MKYLLAVLLLAAAPSPQWVRVASDTDGAVWMADANSVRTERQITTVWLRMSSPRSPGYMIQNVGYDCVGWSSGTLTTINYRANGTVIEREDGISMPGSTIGYKSIAPNSVDDIIARWACQGR